MVSVCQSEVNVSEFVEQECVEEASLILADQQVKKKKRIRSGVRL